MIRFHEIRHMANNNGDLHFLADKDLLLVSSKRVPKGFVQDALWGWRAVSFMGRGTGYFETRRDAAMYLLNSWWGTNVAEPDRVASGGFQGEVRMKSKPRSKQTRFERFMTAFNKLKRKFTRRLGIFR